METKYKVTAEQAQEIRNLLKQYEKTSAFRKLQAIMLVGEGMTVKATAQITLYHATWVYELIKQFCTQDFEEFVKERRGGANHRNMTDEQEQKIIDSFREEAESGKVVDLSDMKAAYENERGKKTANSTFYAFLDRAGWRRVMPRGQHPKKASEEVIEASKKLTFS